MLDWASASAGGYSFSVGPFDDGATFRLGDWLGDTEMLDAWVVLLVGVAGLAALGMALAGRIDSKRGASLAASAGGVLVSVAIIEMQFIWSQPGPLGPAMGLYLLLVGGVAAAISPFLPAKPIGG